MRLWPTYGMFPACLSPLAAIWYLTDSTYFLSVSLFRFPAWLYSATPLAKTAAHIETDILHQECSIMTCLQMSLSLHYTTSKNWSRGHEGRLPAGLVLMASLAFLTPPTTTDPRWHYPQWVGPTHIVLVRVAVKRHYAHCNSYKGKHLTEVAAYSSEVQSIIMVGAWWWGACPYAGRHGAGYIHLDQKATGNGLAMA